MASIHLLLFVHAKSYSAVICSHFLNQCTCTFHWHQDILIVHLQEINNVYIIWYLMADFPLMINENVMMTHLKCIKGGF